MKLPALVMFLACATATFAAEEQSPFLDTMRASSCHGTAALDYGSRLHPDATARFDSVGKYVLGLGPAV